MRKLTYLAIHYSVRKRGVILSVLIDFLNIILLKKAYSLHLVLVCFNFFQIVILWFAHITTFEF